MKAIDVQQLLRELSRIEEGEDNASLSDAALQAYREGRLAPKEAARVAQALALSPASRQRLAALAGKAMPAPSPAVRDRVLAGGEGVGNRMAQADEFKSSAGPVRRRGAARWFLPVAGLAAAVVLALILWPSEPAPPGDNGAIEFLLTIKGLAENRSEVEPGQTAKAFPNTMVEVVAVPEQPKKGHRFGLYRVSGSQAIRVKGIEPDIQRRRVKFRAAAEQFVGRQPGSYTLLVVIATKDLPDNVVPGTGQTAQQALAKFGRVHAVRLELTLPDPS